MMFFSCLKVFDEEEEVQLSTEEEEVQLSAEGEEVQVLMAVVRE